MLDAYDRASSFDCHAGVKLPHHQAPKSDALLDRLCQGGTEADYIPEARHNRPVKMAQA